jgi:electron transfer flavoprotein beta subunit
MPNPLDLSAIEEALRVRTAAGGEVTAVTVGPPQADVALRKARMMGADRTVRLWDETFQGCDAAGMAQVLAAIAKKLGFDLLLCGARSADSGSELVGAALAEHLGVPLVCRAIGVRFDRETSRIIAYKKLEKGARETYAVAMPAVLTIERSIEPRYSSRNWVYRLRKERIEVLAPSDVGIVDALAEPRIRSIALVAPKPRTKIGVKVSGLSLKDKLAVMRGRASKPQREAVVVCQPVDAARTIKEHLDRWLD